MKNSIIDFIDSFIDTAQDPGEKISILRDLVYFMIKSQPIHQQQLTLNWAKEHFSLNISLPIILDEDGQIPF